MKTPVLCENTLHNFTCSGQKECLTKTYYEIFETVFPFSNERTSNTINFSYAFSKALESLILGASTFDRNRQIYICIERKVSTVDIKFSYQQDSDNMMLNDGDEVKISYPIQK